MRRSPAPELSDSITRNRIENTSVAGFSHSAYRFGQYDGRFECEITGQSLFFFPVSHERGFDGRDRHL